MTELSLLIYTFTLSLYIVASLLFLLHYKDGAKGIFPYGRMSLRIALLSLTVLMFVRFFLYGYLPVYTFHERLLLLTFSASLCLVLLDIYHPRFRRTFFFVLPVITMFLLLAAFSPQGGIILLPELKSALLLLHIITIIPAYGALVIAFMASIMYLVVDYRLKKKKHVAMLGRLPSLDTLDNLNYLLVTVGFLMLTISIILGAFWGEQIWGSLWRFAPKETWALVTWLVYAVYLHARLLSGWRGKSIVLLNIAGFSAINYLVVRFLFSGSLTTFF